MIHLKKYQPHAGQSAFHYAIAEMFRYVAMVCGIRGGKTHAGARESLKQAWNARGDGVYGIVSPTFQMLERTTWRDFRIAARPFIAYENKAYKIITLKNGREVHGFSAEKPDRIRNVTLVGFWLDEARECKEGIWEIMLGRVLSTGGKGIVTTSPNSFDWIHDVFVESDDPEYGMIRFATHQNTYLNRKAIDALERKYDKKFAQQELYGEFVVFEGAVYYTFNRTYNAGDIAFKVAQYNPRLPLMLACDFNVDPMAWVIAQKGKHLETGLDEIYAIDEIWVRNSNTIQCCDEFKRRFPNHDKGVILYGDATGDSRTANSNVTNWKIVKDELARYGLVPRIRNKNPAERDRINATNGMICNSKGDRRVQINPKTCKHLIRDLEQVPYKEGASIIDKAKNRLLTHPSDGLGYLIERDYSLNKAEITGLKI